MNMPTISIQLEGMTQQIVCAFTKYQHDITRAVDEELKKVVGEFDFEGVIREKAERVLRQSIESAIQHTMLSGEVKDTIRALVRKAVIRGLNPQTPPSSQEPFALKTIHMKRIRECLETTGEDKDKRNALYAWIELIVNNDREERQPKKKVDYE